jgi:hypothetical protein
MENKEAVAKLSFKTKVKNKMSYESVTNYFLLYIESFATAFICYFTK